MVVVRLEDYCFLFVPGVNKSHHQRTYCEFIFVLNCMLLKKMEGIIPSTSWVREGETKRECLKKLNAREGFEVTEAVSLKFIVFKVNADNLI
jgi:hypothetical protein